MNTHWQRRPEAGGQFAIWLIRSIARYGGRTISRLLLLPITLYFLVVRGPERRASRAFLGRVFGRPATLWEVARHIHCFSATILDRVFLLSGEFRRFDIRTFGLEAMHGQIDKGRGILLFGSHHGSFEALRAISRERADIRVRVVMDRHQNAAITRLLEALCPDIARSVIDAGQEGTAIILAINDAVLNGDLVSLLVDRAREGGSQQRVPFLGQPAEFPNAPWLVAAALKVPVVLCFGLYRGGHRYDLHFEVFEERIDIPRGRRYEVLAALQSRYAQRLEHHVRLAPYNWFNFYDFWQCGSSDDAVAAAPADTRADAADGDAGVGGNRRNA